ncbi:hypothetical protein MRX96_028002 [Rhipicephalus microplus]
MDILAHALRELNSSRLPAFCAKFKVSFSAGSANDTGDDSRLDDSRRDPCVVIGEIGRDFFFLFGSPCSPWL